MQTTIYVIGVFDLFHTGHVELLKRAKALGDKLIVAINGDEMVASYKRRPYFKENDRLKIIKACRFVDEAFVIRQYDNKEVIKAYGINKIVHGDDWEEKGYMEQIRVTPEFLEKNHCELVILPYTAGISTSDLIKRIKESWQGLLLSQNREPKIVNQQLMSWKEMNFIRHLNIYVV